MKFRPDIWIGTALLAIVCSAILHASPADPKRFDLQSAVDAAEPGSTIRVPAGTYPGPLIINQSVELIAEPGAIIQGDRRGDVVKIHAPDVTLRGFTIRGTGKSLDRENAGITVLAPRATIEDNVLEDVLFGIYLKKADGSTIRGNRIGGKDLPVPRRGDGIRLWYSPGCVVEQNTVRDSRDVVIWFSNNTTIRNNTVTGGRYGLHFMYCDDTVLDGNNLEGNSVGAFLMYSRNLTIKNNRFVRNHGPSGYGVGLKEVDGVLAEGNLFAGNRVGLYFDNSPASVDITQHFTGNVVAYNDIGLAFMPSIERNVFTDNNFIENVEQVAVLGSGRLKNNRFAVDGRGNFWSDYTGFDLNGDGIGDVSYKAQSLFENLMDREPRLRLFLFSPVQQAIELAAKAVPTFRPPVKITDEAPLMQTVPVAAARSDEPPAWPTTTASLVLLFSAGSLLMLGVTGTLARPSAAGGPIPVTKPKHNDRPAQAAQAPGPILSAGRITKRFGRLTAVKDFDLDLRPGEAVALWGPNGAGKTTALRCMLGLIRCKGSVTISGFDVRRKPKDAKRCVGYVPQELAFYDDWRAGVLLSFFAKIKRVDRKRVSAVLAEVGLTEHAAKRVGELSGGMKQRLALAAALLADPPVLILDELTANLDAAARDSFLALLCKQRDAGKAILFTSHRLREVETLADRVLVMDRGEVVTTCEPRKLAEALGLRSSLRLWIEEDRLDAAVQRLRTEGFEADRNGLTVSVKVRPDEKGRPIAALSEAGIGVRDFEIDSNDNGLSGPRPGQGGTR
jgi:nitrous oxidase accessory protein/Cu-processing system ATP-binding protein